jgi:hypothetical protein
MGTRLSDGLLEYNVILLAECPFCTNCPVKLCSKPRTCTVQILYTLPALRRECRSEYGSRACVFHLTLHNITYSFAQIAPATVSQITCRPSRDCSGHGSVAEKDLSTHTCGKRGRSTNKTKQPCPKPFTTYSPNSPNTSTCSPHSPILSTLCLPSHHPPFFL